MSNNFHVREFGIVKFYRPQFNLENDYLSVPIFLPRAPGSFQSARKLDAKSPLQSQRKSGAFFALKPDLQTGTKINAHVMKVGMNEI